MRMPVMVRPVVQKGELQDLAHSSASDVGALHQLEHQGRHVASIFETIDCPDVRMVER